MFIEEIPGTTYSRLTIVSRAANSSAKNTPTAAMWNCICSCGKETIVRGSSLRRGKTRSCGCLRDDITRESKRLPSGESGRNRAVANTIANAKRRGLEWGLTDDQVFDIMGRDCFYCGTHPMQVSKGRNGNFIYNGLDRVDNSIGYIIDNVVACCGKCNTGKMAMTKSEFISWIIKVHENLKDKGEL